MLFIAVQFGQHFLHCYSYSSGSQFLYSKNTRVIYLNIFQVSEFIHHVCGPESFYGFQDSETLDSLVLDLLPRLDHKYMKLNDKSQHSDPNEDIQIQMYFVHEIFKAFKVNSGFQIGEV